MPRTMAVKRGAELIQEIRSTEIPHGRIGVWWLGQATFCFKFGKTIVYSDPFYRAEDQPPEMICETPLKPSEFVDASLIVCTHEHLDHIDPETLPGAAKASPNARVVVPQWTVDFTTSLGVDSKQLSPMRGDDTKTIAGITLHAIPAAHETLDFDPQKGFRYLGYVFEGNGARIYLPGDVQPYPGWYERVSKFPAFDTAFLPISARDNLHYLQAVYFCALHRPKLAVPMHYNMFAAYTEDPQKFVAALKLNCPEQKAKVMTLGEGWMV